VKGSTIKIGSKPGGTPCGSVIVFVIYFLS